MNICVLGAGAIGGWVAAKLALAGERVSALTSRGPLGSIELSESHETRTAEFVAPAGPADILVVAVKATALPSACETAASLIGSDTIIVPMLNGVPWWFVDGTQLRSVDPDGRIAATLPTSQIIGCVVHASCSRSGGSIVVKHA